MKAVVFERNGGPEVLDFKDAPDPVAVDGKVLVDVEAAGVNFRDVYEREGGGYGSPPGPRRTWSCPRRHRQRQLPRPA